jgi:transcriptional regulator with XRE-family HTH domain
VPRRLNLTAKTLARRVRDLRTANGWSQEQLATEAGMHRTYLWGIEQGRRNPSLRHLARLAVAFGVPIQSLFRDPFVTSLSSETDSETGSSSRAHARSEDPRHSVSGWSSPRGSQQRSPRQS